MKAVVAGGAGFIGSQLVDRLLDKGYEVLAVDMIPADRARNIAHLSDRRGFEYMSIDMNGDEFAEVCKGADEMYHLAANSDIRSGGQDPHIDFDNTLCTTRSALEAVRANGIPRMFFSSTSAVYGDKKDHVVLVRQFRYPLGDYVYEFPAGLVEAGEDMLAAGIREMYEETGLTFTPKEAGSYSRPFYTTVGMTDESCATVYGYCAGDATSLHQEESEDIQVVIADREECRRILREEHVAIMCAYMLMHFIACEGDPLAFLDA